MGLCQCPLGDLQHAGRILHVPVGHVETPYLVLQGLADGHPGGVISRLVDPQARRQLGPCPLRDFLGATKAPLCL